MYIFNVNLPLPEIFFILVLILLISLVLILYNLKRLQRMTIEEKKEIEVLEKLAQDEKKDLEQIKAYETMESVDLEKFEKDIEALEKETDTFYIKHLAPDLYKVQNYVLWSLQKGTPPDKVKASLMDRGWKDNKLIEMVIDDVLKYKGYYDDRKGNVVWPKMPFEESKPAAQALPIVPIKPAPIKHVIERQPIVIHKTHVLKTEIMAPKRKPKKAKKPKKRKSAEFSKFKRRINKLEKDLKKEHKTKKSKKKR